MDISALPGLRQKALAISCLAGARVLFGAMSLFLGGFSPLNAVVLPVLLLLTGLQIAGLWMCLNEGSAPKGLYLHWLYGRIVYILGCVLLGLMGLSTLLTVFSALAGGKEGLKLLTVAGAELLTVLLALTLAFYNKQRAKLAKQLRQSAVTPSRAPEVWTLLYALSILALTLCQAAAYLFMDKAPLPDSADRFALSAHDFMLSLAQPGLSAGQHWAAYLGSALLIAALFIASALFKSVRINAPLLKTRERK